MRRHIPGNFSIEQCYQNAQNNNSKTFAMQYGDQCFIDSDPARDYKMYGSTPCAPRDGFPKGSGGAYINHMYQVS